MMDVSTDRLREAALSDALKEQESLLAQKDVLLAEVNHRVKNSLSSWSALSACKHGA